MKKLLILLFGVLVGLPALSQIADVQLQTQNVDGKELTTIQKVKRLWNNSKYIPATPGTSYQWVSPGDTAYYFVPPAGKQILIKVQFLDVSNPEPTLKETLDNTTAVYKLADGTIVNSLINVFNASVWNSFSKAVTPFPSWCAAFHMETCHFAYAANLTATFTFTGKKIEIIGEKHNNKGIAAIKIDNGVEVQVDLYDAVTINNSQVLYWATVPQGTHTVTVRVTGVKNPLSSGTNVLIDGLKVYE